MDETANLKLPYIMAAQAQKHVTHNEAIRSLDAIVQLAVHDRDLAAPPVAPQDGDRFIVAIGATGDWLGHDLEVAAFQDGAWMFHAPIEGWIAWVSDEDGAIVWDGAAWTPLASGGGGGGSSSTTGSFLLLGVNEAADLANRFKVSSPASLFDHEGNGHQLKINKAAAADTASLLYQTGYAGRAEMGLAGNDDFSIKVSPDGTTWHDAILVDRTDGSVTFPNSTVTGAPGPQGPAGPAGPQGPAGPEGPAGSDGTDGVNGANGADGTNGADGADGIGVPAGGSTGQILAKASATDYDTNWIAAPTGGGGSGAGGAPAVIIKDVKSETEHGGAFSAGSWATRDLNTLERNEGSLATLAGNQFTLPPGTYFIRAIAPAYRVLRHKIRLYDITNATNVASSPVEYGSTSTEVTTKAELATVVTLMASTVFEIQHICQTTKTVNGFGINSDGIAGAAESVYTQVLIWAA